MEELDADRPYAQESGPFQDCDPRHESISRVSGGPLQDSPKDRKRKGDKGPGKPYGMAMRPQYGCPRQRKDPHLEDSGRPVGRHPQRRDGEHK